jgi:hypothetical protein
MSLHGCEARLNASVDVGGVVEAALKQAFTEFLTRGIRARSYAK